MERLAGNNRCCSGGNITTECQRKGSQCFINSRFIIFFFVVTSKRISFPLKWNSCQNNDLKLKKFNKWLLFFLSFHLNNEYFSGFLESHAFDDGCTHFGTESPVQSKKSISFLDVSNWKMRRKHWITRYGFKYILIFLLYWNTLGRPRAGLPKNVLVGIGSIGSWPIWINVLVRSIGWAPVATAHRKTILLQDPWSEPTAKQTTCLIVKVYRIWK